jgi:hypothetical protein
MGLLTEFYKENNMLNRCIIAMIAVVGLVLMSSYAYAGKVIKLSSKESKSLTNHTLWTLNATCNIQGKQSKSKILVSVIENNCKVNGKTLSKGQATSVTVKNNESISVSAEPGTTVNLINMGTDSVEAVCA